MPETALQCDVSNWILGAPGHAASGQVLENIDPATGHRIGTVPRSGPEDVQAAVDAARKVQGAWAGRCMDDRCDVLLSIAHGIAEHAEALARMETQDTGKPISTSRTIDIPRAERNFRFFAGFARSWHDETFPMEQGWNYVHRRPVGIAGLITPWNLPLYLLSWKVAPALAMGNAIIAKPSELTPQSATALGRIAKDAGLPDGLLNIVHGLGPEAGQAIVEHPEIGAISFTGGTVTGRQVAATAAPMFKKLSLELGGKNPTIIFDDCDLDTAVHGAIRAGFTNTGQVCLCGSRILVQEGIHARFLARLQEEVRAMEPADPQDPDTRIGPLVSHAHRDKVASYVDQARVAGHDVVGGDKRGPAAHPDGAWLTPAVISGMAQRDACVQEEIFGPVVTVQSFTDEAEALRLANDVPYGLAASVWTPDEDKARRVAEGLETGMVWINDWLVRDLRVPFGGMKQSGVGREGGAWSLSFFSEARNIYVGP